MTSPSDSKVGALTPDLQTGEALIYRRRGFPDNEDIPVVLVRQQEVDGRPMCVVRRPDGRLVQVSTQSVRRP